MDDIRETLWICPICLAEHQNPVIVCNRCECQILLLNKIKLIALYLSEEGYKDLSILFYEAKGGES